MGVYKKSSVRVLLLAGGVILALTVGRAGAQGTQPALSPAKLLGLIEANGGYAFAAAAADIEAARARLDGARFNLFPRLTGTVTGKFVESKKSSETRDSDVVSRLELVQPIYDFGQTYSRVRAARKEISAAGERLKVARNTVLLEGLAVFFDLHASELRMHSFNQNHASAYVHWERSHERLGLGQADPIEVAEKLARVEKTRLAYHRERSRNAALRLRLEDMTGTVFAGELIDTPKPPSKRPKEVDTDKLFKFAEKQNSEIAALAKRAEALAFQSEGSAALPRIEAFGSVGSTTTEHRGRQDWALGARLTVPFFDGGAKQAERSRLKAERKRVLAEFEVRRRDLRRQLRQTVLGRSDAWQQIIAARADLDFLGRQLARRQRLYEQERVADLGRSMINFTGAEAALVQAVGAYYVDGAYLAILLGVDPASGLQENFLADILGGDLEPEGEQFTPKGGTGFGQDDQFKTDKK
jgi:outer membrane protein TolC